MSDLGRWFRAQTAESRHEAHTTVRPGRTARKTIERFGEYETIADHDIVAVGAGTGIIHRLQTGRRRVAIDPLTHEYFGNSSESDAEVLTAAGERLPFAEETFDTAISINVLDHTADPEAVLSEIRRVLRTDGRLLFNLNVFDTPAVLNRYLGLIDTPHPHHYNETEVLGLFRQTGFDPEVVNRWTPGSARNSFKRRVGTAVFGMEKIDVVATPA
jgi:SAM-dependent methyltransferase